MAKKKYIHNVAVDPGTDLRSDRLHLVYLVEIHNLSNGIITKEFYDEPSEAQKWVDYWNEQWYTYAEWKTLITDKDYIQC